MMTTSDIDKCTFGSLIHDSLWPFYKQRLNDIKASISRYFIVFCLCRPHYSLLIQLQLFFSNKLKWVISYPQFASYIALSNIH